jgi:hypothetical protein
MVSMFLKPTLIDMTTKSNMTLRKGKRVSSQIDTLVLHQTAKSRGNVPDLYKHLAVHLVLMPNGGILKLHPFEALTWSSNAFNDDCIALEVAGNFATDRGVWQEPGNGKDVLTQQQISEGRSLVRLLHEDYGIRYIYAHRQGWTPKPGQDPKVNQRGNCPGPEIWYNLGQWAVDNLRMDDGGPGYFEGNGSPIPDSWRRPLRR